jgi:hypothetical protein
MKATLRHLEPGEPDSELLILGASGGIVLSGLAWVESGLPLPRCAFRAVTGCPCPTCGATRCLLALLHGRITEAAEWNPLVFAGIVGMLVLGLYYAVTLVAGLPRVRLAIDKTEGRLLRWGCIILVASNWAYVIRHGV